MALFRSLCASLCWALALLCVGAAFYQVRPEAEALVRSWPNVDKAPALAADETSPSDRSATAVTSPLAQFLAATQGVLPWLILAGVLVGNATLMRTHSAVERME